MKNFAHFIVPAHKRTIYSYEKYFLQFPDMEFFIPYNIDKNKKIYTSSPHLKFFYVYENKRYVPGFENYSTYKDGIYFCGNSRLYGKEIKHKDLNGVKNLIFDSFFNSEFEEIQAKWIKFKQVDEELIKLLDRETIYGKSKLIDISLKSVENIEIAKNTNPISIEIEFKNENY